MATQRYLYSDEKIEAMCAEWERTAPKRVEGWYGTIMTTPTGELTCPIEEYDDDGCIIRIGTAFVKDGKYWEV